MKNTDTKIKQFFLLILKIIIVGLAVFFINKQLSEKEWNWEIITQAVQRKNSYLFILAIVTLTFLNRFVEILKWQNLASTIKQIGIWQSTKEVLIAITIGLFTPNGIGEYAGKALFYPKQKAANVVFLNAICNGIQVFFALSFGLLSTMILQNTYHFLPKYSLVLVVLGIIATLSLLFIFRTISIKGYSLQKLIDELRKIPSKIHKKNIFRAFMRYVILLHQYVLLYYFFDVNVSYFSLLMIVSCIYLLASSLPNFHAIDFALKGSIAIYLFQFYHVDAWIVTIVATSIWLLNLVLPISFGSILLLFYNPKKS